MVYIAHFFAASFLVNGLPHFFQGISGNRFQTPFANPPAVGESSPIINILWGLFNFAVGYALLVSFGDIEIGITFDTLITASGALLTTLGLSWHFDRVRNPKKENKKENSVKSL